MSYASRQKAIAIADISSAVVDTGRRGAPKPGCDCVQCFGYCLYDPAKAERDVMDSNLRSPREVEWTGGFFEAGDL